MTDDGSLDPAAERIAARGHDALVQQLRDAYAKAAAAHADIVKMEADQIEALVQRSAQNADGLQWRRALATVATEELGLSLPEALLHPAVARAQEIVGAPSYEETLAELTRRASAPADAAPRRPTPEEDEPGFAEGEDEPGLAEGEEPPGDGGEVTFADAQEFSDDEPFPEGEDEDRLRVSAIHLGGVANLEPSQQDIDLRLSGDGLDIMRGEHEILGRLAWREIETLEVPVARGRRRRRVGHARLIVRTRHGDASFEVPAFSSEELRQRISPLVARFGRG